MSSSRLLRQAAGVTTASLGIGLAMVVGEPSSPLRVELTSRVSEERLSILVDALSRRFAIPLRRDVELCGTLSKDLLSSELMGPKRSPLGQVLLVVGPDFYLNYLATERISASFPNPDVSPPLRLVLPSDFNLGDGTLSTEVEKQLLSDVGGLGPPVPSRVYSRHDSRWMGVNEDLTGVLTPPRRRTLLETLARESRICKSEPILTTWETMFLRFSRALMGTSELDEVTQRALEEALRISTLDPANEHAPVVSRLDGDWKSIPENEALSDVAEKPGNVEESIRLEVAANTGREEGIVLVIMLLSPKDQRRKENLGVEWRRLTKWCCRLVGHGLVHLLVRCVHDLAWNLLLSITILKPALEEVFSGNIRGMTYHVG
ncbi:unnamed protein product [Choristocarpus tenellus]